MTKPPAITFEEAMALQPGELIYQLTATNADGTATRWKVNGETKWWITRPGEFQIPLKRGLREYGYLTHENMKLFSSTEPKYEGA